MVVAYAGACCSNIDLAAAALMSQNVESEIQINLLLAGRSAGVGCHGLTEVLP